MENMNKRIVLALIVISFFASCARSVTPGEAASHHYGSCRNVRLGITPCLFQEHSSCIAHNVIRPSRTTRGWPFSAFSFIFTT